MLTDSKVDFFGEKTRQISVDEFEAFGIKISSRYKKNTEVVNMLQFAETLALLDLNDYVCGLFYDSQSNTCEIEIQNDPSPQILKKIHDFAAKYLPQFESPYYEAIYNRLNDFFYEED